MAVYQFTAGATSVTILNPIATDKVRIATTTAVTYAVSPLANVTAVTTSNPNAASTSSGVIGANQIERDIYVGRGNYLAIIAVTTSGLCSVTELGAIPNRTTNNGYYDGPLINPGA
jgi:hypothetical protein